MCVDNLGLQERISFHNKKKKRSKCVHFESRERKEQRVVINFTRMDENWSDPSLADSDLSALCQTLYDGAVKENGLVMYSAFPDVIKKIDIKKTGARTNYSAAEDGSEERERWSPKVLRRRSPNQVQNSVQKRMDLREVWTLSRTFALKNQSARWWKSKSVRHACQIRRKWRWSRWRSTSKSSCSSETNILTSNTTDYLSTSFFTRIWPSFFRGRTSLIPVWRSPQTDQ